LLKQKNKREKKFLSSSVSASGHCVIKKSKPFPMKNQKWLFVRGTLREKSAGFGALRHGGAKRATHLF